jgi:hypothetical protein
MRRAAAFAALLLAACGSADEPGATANGAAAPPPGEADNRIECRPAGAADFERVCRVDRADTEAGRVLTIRKADGGFRRLLVAADGRGVVAADGAERATVTNLPDNRMEVEIGGDRFRLPAAVR